MDLKLIEIIHALLCAMSCGRKLYISALEDLCEETVNIYLSKYNRYYMPQTLHKILIHGLIIIQSFSIPIGLLSEEPQEAKK